MADIAVEHPVHGAVAGQVGADFLDGVVLG